MNDLNFLKKYIIPSVNEAHNPVYKDYKHQFFSVLPEELMNLPPEMGSLPLELEAFYHNIGYGNFHVLDSSLNNSIFPIADLTSINLKLDEYALDPDLDVYDCFSIGNRLLFFNVIDGIYLFIDKQEKNNKNAIYYFDLKIFDSLSEFVVALDKNQQLLTEISKNY